MLLTTVLLTIFSTSPAELSNLCDDVYLDEYGVPISDSKGQTLPRFCEWTGPDVPIWDAPACCIFDAGTAYCSTPNALGECDAGDEMYCEYGAEIAGGGLLCYQPFPSACDAGLCIEAPDGLPPIAVASEIICCSAGGACQWVEPGHANECPGSLWYCPWGMSTTEGTVECYG